MIKCTITELYEPSDINITQLYEPTKIIITELYEPTNIIIEEINTKTTEFKLYLEKLFGQDVLIDG